MRIVLTISFLLISLLAQAQAPGRAYGGTNNDAAWATCIFPGGGGYAIVGRTRSSGAGSNDMYVLRINEAGRLIWSRTLGAERQDQAQWVEPTGDGGIVVLGYGYTNPGGKGRHDFKLTKLDRQGEIIWEKVYGAIARDVGFCVKPTNDGGYAMLGYTRSFGNKGDFYLVKADAEGNKEWAQSYVSPFVDYGHEVHQTADGGYLLFGSESGFFFPSQIDHHKAHADLLLIKTDANGNEQWRRQFGSQKHELGRALEPAPGGGWYLFGSTQGFGEGSFDMYLVRMDSAGNGMWHKTYGGPDYDYGTSMEVDADGNLYLLGTSNTLGNTGSPDIYLVKADSGGAPIWSITIGEAGAEYGQHVRALPEGGCILTGSTRSYGQGGQDVYFVRVTSDGQIDLFATPETEAIVVYPNPVTAESTVDPTSFTNGAAFEWRMLDGTGRLIRREMIGPGERGTINADDFPAGAYIYEVRVGTQRLTTGKIIIY